MTSIDPAQIATTVVEMAGAGRFAEIREMFAASLRTMVSAEAIQLGWDGEVSRLGAVTAVGAAVTEPATAGMVTVRVPVTLEHGQIAVLISVAGDGSLTGLQLAPPESAAPAAPWEPPAYADPASFHEQDVTVGSGPLAVPGTLTLPSRPGPWPAVVMLVGSGPNDRDSTIGRNKPLKDIAWGLATRGVAVLRYDKVTYVHRDQLADVADFTVADEYLPDAVAAVDLLRRTPDVDPARIFVLGHSLGGTIAPRVAAAEPSVAGLVIMAGGVQPLHHAAVRQVRYLASLDPATAAAAAPVLEAMTRQADTVDSPDLSTSTPNSELPFNVPAAYWLDLRSYHPVAVAATLDKPILLLQGGRDYQATVADDLTEWQAGLAGRTDVTVHVYDADNHLFLSGTGPSTPAEYERAQHVDPAVVDDIATWLAAT